MEQLHCDGQLPALMQFSALSPSKDYCCFVVLKTDKNNYSFLAYLHPDVAFSCLFTHHTSPFETAELTVTSQESATPLACKYSLLYERLTE